MCLGNQLWETQTTLSQKCVRWVFLLDSGTEDEDDDDEEDTPKKKTKKKTAKDSSPSASSAKEKKSKSKGMALEKVLPQPRPD